MAHSTGPSCCWYHKGTIFQANHNMRASVKMVKLVVVDTTKVRFFKQITTRYPKQRQRYTLLLIPQRYDFSSKSQPSHPLLSKNFGCCWYHKGTIFQANHNLLVCLLYMLIVVVDTTKVRFFKQITTQSIKSVCTIQLLLIPQRYDFSSKSQPLDKMLEATRRCCWYHKGTIFQANHNALAIESLPAAVVVDTTKVRFFKQITTPALCISCISRLLLIPQRYDFSSKSQQHRYIHRCCRGCCWYHKGTIFQANHNKTELIIIWLMLLLIPQRYDFSSKSQHGGVYRTTGYRCCWYHKGTIFQANHNDLSDDDILSLLLLIPQRYDFSSKSQQYSCCIDATLCCCWYHKGTIFQANHNSPKGYGRKCLVAVDTTKVRFFKQNHKHVWG